MEAKSPIQTGPAVALQIAYVAIKKLGYTHKKLVEENRGVNHNTLRNVRDGKQMKSCTITFYLELFVSLLNKEYENRIGRGDTDSLNGILRTMRKILLLMNHIALPLNQCKDEGASLH